MCVDSLLLTFNSDEKFSSQYSHLTAFYVSPKMVAAFGGVWALRAGIGMTINLPGHPMSVNCTILSGLLSTHFHSN